MNKITFLGTAGDSFVSGKQIRASGGIIIRLGEVQLHLDPGPGALARAKEHGINLRANTAVLVSNNNLLHCNDVNAVIDAMTYGGMDKKGVLVSNKSFLEGSDNEKSLLSNVQKSFVEKIVMMEKGQKLGIENVEIHALDADGPDPNTIGFKILAPDFTLVYTSDTKYSREIIKEYEGADILILNVPMPGEEKAENQLNSSSATKIIKKINPKLSIISHFGIKMIKGDPLYEGREIQKASKVQVLIAKDGLSISPRSYSAKSDQKRLSTFKDQDTGEVKEDLIEKKEEIEQRRQEDSKGEEREISEEPVEDPGDKDIQQADIEEDGGEGRIDGEENIGEKYTAKEENKEKKEEKRSNEHEEHQEHLNF
ncbi:hypothetical protein GF361_02200 [Candidatus Woesearchaeota archaeon]|nr:hypothetical protein [Candidatus Woesearchaeota archaeon]